MVSSKGNHLKMLIQVFKSPKRQLQKGNHLTCQSCGSMSKVAMRKGNCWLKHQATYNITGE
jgi:hypothetical protein